MENAAAAKLLQSCPTLCNPIDGSSPGSTVPRILQARTLEWVAIAFSPVENGIHINSFPQSTPAMRTLSWKFQRFSVIHSKGPKRLT